MNELVIIITDRTTTQDMCAVEETLHDLDLLAYNNGDNICGLRRFNKALCLKDINSDPGKVFDVLVLPDVLLDEDFADIIEYFTENLDIVYILYHKNVTNPSLPDVQTEFMQEVISGAQINKLYQSHISDSIYCNEFKELGRAVKNNDENAYNAALVSMKKKFPDPAKEKKLTLLHACLTSEGASQADISILTIEQKEIVDYLSKQKDNFSLDYIEKLTELRISLLGS